MPPAPTPGAAPRPIDMLDVPAGSVEVLPPPERRDVLRESLTGLAFVGIAGSIALLADLLLNGGPSILSTLRLGLVFIGAVIVGHAISRRADWWATWASAAAAGYLAGGLAIPAHWDSIRLLVWVLAAVATAAAVLAAFPPQIRYPAIACITLVHFGGILTAVTSPDPTPWVSAIAAQRFYAPYLQFAYLRNAYHFYSPEPGPANLFMALLTYELDQPHPRTGSTIVHEWITIPRRGAQTTDPLGLSYYRRLSLSEYSARFQPDFGVTTDELKRVRDERNQLAAGTLPGYSPIPLPPANYELPGRWYQHPQVDASRYTIPSYARHLAAEQTRPGQRVTNVKLYRAEHRIINAQHFVKRNYDPYHPTLFRVYFLGDFSPDGTLVNPRDPMLYWLVPVVPKSDDVPPQNWSAADFYDYLSEHAGHEFEWRSLRP